MAFPESESDATRQKKTSNILWSTALVTSGAVAGVVASVSGAAIVVVATPLSVPLLIGSTVVVVGGGVVAGTAVVIAGILNILTRIQSDKPESK